MNRDCLMQGLFFCDMICGTFSANRNACPVCGSEGAIIAKKNWLLKLKRCETCSLLFRTPTDPKSHNINYYQKTYFEGATTEMPSESDLIKQKQTNFHDMEKDFSSWIKILRRLVKNDQAQLLDYGCSWGYGSWQFKQAGYDVAGFEISRPRGQYASDKLGIKVFFEEKELLSNKYDIVFSSHVIEHVPNPKEMVNTVLRILKPGGIFVALSPNGSFKRREVDALKWMSNWGRKHPIYLDEKFFSSILGEMSYLITSRLTEADCEKWLQTEKALVCDLTGEELCVFAKKIR